MIKVKIREWDPLGGSLGSIISNTSEGTLEVIKNLVHTSTIWELASDRNFNTILYSRSDDVHLNFFQYDITVPEGMSYWVRAIRVLNYGQQQVKSLPIEITAEDQVRNNIIRDYDLFIDAPTVMASSKDIEYEEKFTIATSRFRSNGDYHTYTHWIILDGNDEVLWCSLYDKTNLTSIVVDNVGQPYNGKNKIVIKVIHGSSSGVESKAGHLAVHYNNANFEIIGSLTNVTPLENLELEFRIIDPEYDLGVTSVTIEENSDANYQLKKTLYLDENNKIIVPWYFLGYDKTLKFTIECYDVEGTVFYINKKLTTTKYEATQIVDSNKKYSKIVYDFIEHDPEDSEDKDLYIPNYYYSEPLHNNLIPLPYYGVDKKTLRGYELVGDKLNYVRDLNGIEITNDIDKEGMFIKRVGNDYIMVSHTVWESKLPVHEILVYKYSVATDTYYLSKTLRPAGEEYGLGHNNGCIQVDNEKVYYIPPYTDTLKRLDIQTYGTTTISNDIPSIEPYRGSNMAIAPTLTNMTDGRLWIAGGYGALSTTYDYYHNNYQDSVYWEYASYIGNRIKMVPLFNGDSLIVKTEDNSRTDDEYQSDIEVDNENFELDLTAREEWDNVNKNVNMGKTEFKLKDSVDELDIIIGDKFTIEFTSNLTSVDPRQIFVSYNTNVFSLEKLTTKQVEFRCYNNIKCKKYSFIIGASKGQQFNQVTFKGDIPYTHTVELIDYVVNVKKEEDVDGLPNDDNSTGYFETNTNSAEQEYLLFMGDKYGYQSGEIALNLYKDDTVNIPFETVNCTIDDLDYDLNPELSHMMDITLTKLSANLGLISINNIINYRSEYITIYNKLRKATFVTFRFSWVEHATGNTPEKPVLVRSDNEKKPYSVLSYVDLSRYLIDVPTRFNTPKLISNRPDLAEVSERTTLNGFNLSFRKRGITILYMSDANHSGGIYCNSYYILNNANIVPDLDIAIPEIDIKREDTRVGLLKNDWTGYKIDKNSELEVTIDQDALSKTLLNISLNNNELSIKSGAQVGDTSFKIITKNKDDNTTKTSTYQVHIVKEENYTVGLKMIFDDSDTGLSGENLYFTPGSINYFYYTPNGGKPLLNIPDSIYIDKEASIESMDDVNPYIKMAKDRDLGKEIINLTFRNQDNINLLTLSKNIYLVPMVWYVEDDFIGKVPLHLYKFICQKGEVNEYTLSYKCTPGYIPTTTRLASDVDYLDGIRYSIRKDSNDETKYKLRIETPKNDTADDTNYKFYLGYTYVSDTLNPIMALDKEWLQTFTVTSVNYKQEVYIKVSNDDFELNKKQSMLLNIETNGNYLKLTSGNTTILSVDNETKEVTALKEGKVALIIQAGGYDQVIEQKEIYFNILPEIPEEDLPQGVVITNPENVRVIVGNRANISIKTNGDYWYAKTDNPKIAMFDDITNQIIGLNVGETKLAITYRGETIQGSTKRINVQVLPKPKGDPDCLYYDKLNHTLLPTNCDFLEHYPTSTLVANDGRVVLGCFKEVEKNIGTTREPVYKKYARTFYTIFE